MVHGDKLKPGRHSVCILLRYFGRQGFSHRDSRIPGIFVDASIAALGECEHSKKKVDTGLKSLWNLMMYSLNQEV